MNATTDGSFACGQAQLNMRAPVTVHTATNDGNDEDDDGEGRKGERDAKE